MCAPGIRGLEPLFPMWCPGVTGLRLVLLRAGYLPRTGSVAKGSTGFSRYSYYCRWCWQHGYCRGNGGRGNLRLHEILHRL